MSHPSINRWGLNLFWYRFWFNDKINSLINHQDRLFDKFILIYIHYGLLNYKNFFINKYWYPGNDLFLTKYRTDILAKYFRIVEYRHQTLKDYKTYKLRIKLKNFYHSKIWILRYQNWLIINFYGFLPLTKRMLKKKKTNREALNFIVPHRDNYAYVIRMKLIFSFFFNSFITKSAHYCF